MNVRELIEKLRYYDLDTDVYNVADVMRIAGDDRVHILRTRRPGTFPSVRDTTPTGASRVYVAVVDAARSVLDKDVPLWRSRNPSNDWSAFTGNHRDTVVARALEARNSWGRARYRVLTGELTGEAVESPNWEVKPLGL